METTTSTRLVASPSAVVQWLRANVEAKNVTKAEAQRMGKRWSVLGELALQKGEVAVFVTAEALECDCGKGLYCPLTIRRRRTLRRIYQKGSK